MQQAWHSPVDKTGYYFLFHRPMQVFFLKNPINHLQITNYCDRITSVKRNCKFFTKSSEELFAKEEKQRRRQGLMLIQKFGLAEFVPTCPHGQAVKTPPSHGGIRSSILLGGAK